MRVLHILDHSIPLQSGYTFRTLSILNEQRALGWETFQLTSSKQGPVSADVEHVDGWDFYRTLPDRRLFDDTPLLNQVAVISRLTKRLHELAQRLRPDILHAHSPVLNAVAALKVGRKLGIPVVYEIRAFWEDAAVDHGTSKEWGVRYRMTRALETYALRKVDAVTTICQGLRKDIVARGIAPDKVTVIPNAVNLEEFTIRPESDGSLKATLGLEDAFVLGFVGSFYAYEGLDILLQAMPQILAKSPDVRVLLVGGGPREAYLRQLASTLGIADHVMFTGRVKHSEVQRYYDAIDVLVYPRLPIRLTELVTPLKPLEAMAQGKLVLASDVGGHRELIKDGSTGLLFKAGDPKALADQVIALRNIPQTWPQMRLDGRDFVERQRNWPLSVAKYEAVYRRLSGRSANC